MEKSKYSKNSEIYQEVLQALNRLLNGSGRRGVSIKEVNIVFDKYRVPVKERTRLLKDSVLKYL